jgi:hypothetical protein
MDRVAAHLHLPRMKAGKNDVISVKPAGPTYYTDRLILSDVKFIVRPAGRRKAIETGHRNVHAFVTGKPVDNADAYWYRRAIYNPFKYESFVDADTLKPVFAAKYAYMAGSTVFYCA